METLQSQPQIQSSNSYYDGGRDGSVAMLKKPVVVSSGSGLISGKKNESENETSSSRGRTRRRSRWDLPPPNESSSSCNDGADHGNFYGGRKRKSRWADDDEHLMEDFTGSIMEFDPEIQALKSRLLEIGSKLQQCGTLLLDDDRASRSPSPEPIYDNMGVRINTRKYRAIGKLRRERQEILSQIIKKYPAFKPPADYCPPKLHKKLYIPMKEYPGYNFIGLIIGPRGNTQKRMERETGAKILIRGRGSVKEGKLQQHQIKRVLNYKPDDPSDENEDLHVLVVADTRESLEAAVCMVEKLLQPVDGEVVNEHKRQQLKELAALNGTTLVRDEEEEFCRVCGERRRHRQHACPCRTFKKKKSDDDVVCKNCGDGGHPTIDCPVKDTTTGSSSKKMEDEYHKFLAEVGGCWTVPESLTKLSCETNNPPQVKVKLPKEEYDETNLYIGCLPPSVEDDDALINLMSPFGEIVRAKVIKDRISGLSKGYGFVKYSDAREANAAIASMNGYRVDGRRIAVRIAGKAPHQGQPMASAPQPYAYHHPPPPPRPGSTVYPPQTVPSNYAHQSYIMSAEQHQSYQPGLQSQSSSSSDFVYGTTNTLSFMPPTAQAPNNYPTYYYGIPHPPMAMDV